MSKQPPPASTVSAVGPCPTVIQIVGRPGTGSLPSTIAPPDHPKILNTTWLYLVSNIWYCNSPAHLGKFYKDIWPSSHTLGKRVKNVMHLPRPHDYKASSLTTTPRGLLCLAILSRNKFYLFFWFGFYGPFKDISLTSSQLLIGGGREMENL